MKDYIEERAVEIAYYIIENQATVRQTAKKFGVSKSTIHKDVTERLLQINPGLANQARKILDQNKSERHIRLQISNILISRSGRRLSAIFRKYHERWTDGSSGTPGTYVASLLYGK